MEELPKGWGQAQLGELVELKYGKGLPEKTRRPGKNAVYGSNGVIGEHDSALTSGPTVIVGRKGSVGEVHISERPCWPIDTTYFIDEFPGIEPRYLFHLLKSLDLAGLDNSTAIPGLNREKAYSVKIDLPPSAEQSRIVEKLDRLMARSGRAREEIERIPKLVERYKQAVLAAAFSGELTSDFQRSELPIEKRPSDNGIDGRVPTLSALPPEWTWTSIGEISDVTGGLTKNPERSRLTKRVPYLRVANVYANELRLDDVAEIGIADGEWERVRLQPRDILVVEGNGSPEQIGRVALWSGEISPCVHQNHIIKIRISASLEPRYILYWMLSPLGRKVIESVASSSSGLHTLSLSKVKGLPVPWCSVEEMGIIVERIGLRFAAIEACAQQSKRGLELLIRLDKQTLAKAFSGELVPQDPNDEPASVLLKRIQNARNEKINGRQKGRAHRENGRSLFE